MSENMLRRFGLESAREPGMVAIELRGHFVAGHVDLLGVYDHDMVAHDDIGGKGRPVFAAQHSCHAGCQAAQCFPFCIHEIPFLLYV